MFRTTFFIVLGSAWLCPLASAQVCTGAFNLRRPAPVLPLDGMSRSLAGPVWLTSGGRAWCETRRDRLAPMWQLLADC